MAARGVVTAAATVTVLAGAAAVTAFGVDEQGLARTLTTPPAAASVMSSEQVVRTPTRRSVGRRAIHGTTNAATLGMPVSRGCLRAGEADMRWLITTVPLGSQLRIGA